MFGRRQKISSAERTRLLDFVLFRLKRGGNIHAALKSYMDGNEEKRSRPVGEMLAMMSAGAAFSEAALEIGFLNERGAVLMDNAPNPYAALKSIQEMDSSTSSGSVSRIWLTTIWKQWFIALLIALVFSPLGASNTLTQMYEQSSQAAISLGAAAKEAPVYVRDPWLITEWVAASGLVLLLGWGGVRLLALKRIDFLYRMFRFRFFEDWIPLLDIYLALKRAGHSDSQSARVIAKITQSGFIHELFSLAAENLRIKGKGLYETFSLHRGAIPVEVLGYLMDGEKTGQRDVYIGLARDFCDHSLSAVYTRSKRWVPSVMGNVNLMVFGVVMADLTLDIVDVMIKPLTG